MKISDFKRLQQATFACIRKLLDAEQWLIDMTNLLKATHVPEEYQVEMVKAQLMGMAKTWWLAEEERLEKPITWRSTLRVLREVLP